MNAYDEVEALPEPLRSRVQTLATIMLAERFVALAQEQVHASMYSLSVAQERAIAAHDRFVRAVITLENALQLHAKSA